MLLIYREPKKGKITFSTDEVQQIIKEAFNDGVKSTKADLADVLLEVVKSSKIIKK